MKQGLITIIQGGQYGSEGKGQVAAEIAKRRGIWHAVRTGSINAGHTVLHEPTGTRVKMQIIPTAWVNIGTNLYLGPGTYIHRGILQRECEIIQGLTGEDIRSRLFIDYRCSVMGGDEATASQSSGRHHTMGATGKGCSEAVIARLRDRGNPDAWKARMFATDCEGYQVCDVPKILNSVYRGGGHILLEGTQGSHLDLLTGPWPYTTNRSCNSAAWLAEAGLPSNWRQNIIMVCRTFPIRVAGNSGPLPGEIEWGTLGREINKRCYDLGIPLPIDIEALADFERNLGHLRRNLYPEAPDKAFSQYTSEERLVWREAISEVPTKAFVSLPKSVRESLSWVEMTTVTKKIRRLARLSIADLQEASLWNNPDEIIITFMNYKFPEMGYSDAWKHVPEHQGTQVAPGVIFTMEAQQFLYEVQEVMGARITGITIGPDPTHQLDISIIHDEMSVGQPQQVLK